MLPSKLLNIFTRKAEDDGESRGKRKVAPKRLRRKRRWSRILGGWRSLLFLAVSAVAVWWFVHGNVCGLPIKYNLGQVDERFGLTEQEMLAAIRDAERWWESSLSQDLFRYDARGEYVLIFNLVFDSRQRATQELRQIEESRTELEDELEQIADEYEQLKAMFERREAVLAELSQAYENRLDKFERTVKSWNRRGGAPQDVYDQLQQEKAKLGEYVGEINSLVNQQNALAARVNALADVETETVEGFNEGVHEFNETFVSEDGGEEEQGIYGSGTINVYQFDDHQDLVMLLAHEMGHALGLGHTDDPSSIMYPMKNERQKTGEVYVSEQSRQELIDRCNF